MSSRFTGENGPLRVIPGSHVASDSVGVGVDHALSVLVKSRSMPNSTLNVMPNSTLARLC